MSEVKGGMCPFYKYRAPATSEIFTCEATQESVSLSDSNSLTKFATIIDNECLDFAYVNCPHYKKKMQSEPK
jgi:hypothetical protein